MCPLSYSGDDSATQAPSPLPAKSATPIASLPVDGESLNVASVYQSFKMLTDGLDAFFDRGFWNDAANTITGANTFSALQTVNGASGDTSAALLTSVAPTARKLLWQIQATQYIRFYSSTSGLEITYNASWTGSAWDHDDDASAAAQFILQNAAAYLMYKAPTVGTWASWTEIFGVDLSLDRLRMLTGYLSVAKTVAGTGNEGVTAAPWCASAGAGELHKELVPIAGGIVASDGDLTQGANVYQITKTATGTYQIVLNSAYTYAWATVSYHHTTFQVANALRSHSINYGTVGGRTAITVYWTSIDTAAGTDTDTDTPFMFSVFGAP